MSSESQRTHTYLWLFGQMNTVLNLSLVYLRKYLRKYLRRLHRLFLVGALFLYGHSVLHISEGHLFTMV